MRPYPLAASHVNVGRPASPDSRLGLLVVLGVAGLGAMALLAVGSDPVKALAVPALGVAGLACARWPAAAITGLLVLTGFTGTLNAFTPLPVNATADLLLAGLWVSLAVIHIRRQGARRVWLWPGVIALGAFLAFTAVEIVTSDSVSTALEDYRTWAWFMTAVPLLALAPWSKATFERAAKGVVLAALAVGLYALYRHIVGSAPEETELAQSIPQNQGNEIVLRFFASFFSAQQLAAWSGSMLPMLVGLILAWPGRWRYLAAVAAGLLCYALLASDVRTGMVAAGIGVAVVLVAHQFSRAFRDTRIATGLITAAGILVVAGVAYTVTVGSSPQTADRFARILDPGNDETYQIRELRWDQALDRAEEEPLGHGLGTAGAVAERGSVLPITGGNLDSSYLKVAIQQGLVIMVLFAVVLILLLVGLVRRATALPDRINAGLALGASGTLAAMMFLFYGGMYIEGLTALCGWILVGLGVAQVSDSWRRPTP